MATRAYFTETTTAPDVSPTISSANWLHINTVRRKLLTTADSSTLGTTAYTPDSADDLVIGNSHHRQYVSEPLSAQTILSSSTVQAQFQTLEANANNNLALTLKVYTVDSTGAVKSALLAIVGKGTEPTTTLRNTSFAATALNGSGGNVSVAEGDRLVIEIGLGGTPTATSGTQGHNGSIRWGCNASSGDLPVDETQAGTTYRPWVEFSQNLLFLKSAAPAADDAEQYADSMAGGKYALIRWSDAAVASTGAATAKTITPAADPLGSYADSLRGSLIERLGWGDQLASVIPAATTLIPVNLVADNLAYTDSASALYAIAVSISDSLGLYADQAPTVLFTGALTVAPAADSLNLLDQAPTILFTAALSAVPSTDSLGLYADQAPTIREGLLITPTADSLAAYIETINGFFTIAAKPIDDLNLWTDQRNVTTGAGAITLGPPSDSLNNWADAPTIGGTAAYSVALSDSLGLYADQLTLVETFNAALAADSLGLYLDQAPTIFRQGILIATPSADLLAAYGEAINGFFIIAAQLSDALTYTDQLLISAGGAKVISLTDALGSYSDALTTKFAINLAFADGLDNWSDQVTRSGVRVGWGDSVGVARNVGTAHSVDLASIRPVPVDNLNLRVGYNYGTVIYLVDENGNYIVDENGNRFLISGFIDNLQQGDSLAITRTAAGVTPRLVTLTDALPTYTDLLQVSIGIVTLNVPLSEALTYNDFLLTQYLGVLSASSSDALGGYSDSAPALSTSGGLLATQSDALGSYSDSLQFQRVGIISIALIDSLAGYADAALINTSGGLQIADSDALGGYSDSIQLQPTATRVISLTDTLGILADALTINLGILRSASDNLAAYTDSPAHRRGLYYSTPAEGMANYLDLITAGGTGQIQAALSDNLGQYTDALPSTFSAIRAQAPAESLAAYNDSLGRLVALNYGLADAVLNLNDLIDLRFGLFNEIRFSLSDNMNQWADGAIRSRSFFAIRVSGELTDRIILIGKVIEEQIELTGNMDDKIDVTGEIYIGEP